MKFAPVLFGAVLALGIVSVTDAAAPKAKPGAGKVSESTNEASDASSSDSALLDGSRVDDILNYARGYGDASLEKQDNGDPKIKGTIDGVGYAIYFMNCTDNTDCEDLNFYAGFADLKPKTSVINDWNMNKRFGKAYLDSDGDAVVEMDLNLQHGVSPDNFDADMGVWQLVVDQFAEHVGFKPADK